MKLERGGGGAGERTVKAGLVVCLSGKAPRAPAQERREGAGDRLTTTVCAKRKEPGGNRA